MINTGKLLHTALLNNTLFGKFQSGFRVRQSTETASISAVLIFIAMQMTPNSIKLLILMTSVPFTRKLNLWHQFIDEQRFPPNESGQSGEEFCKALCWKDRAERTSGSLSAAARQQTAADRWGALEERAEGRATASTKNKHPESHRILLWSRAVYQWEQSPEFVLGLKSGFIFTLASQPVCSSELRRCRPPLWVL